MGRVNESSSPRLRVAFNSEIKRKADLQKDKAAAASLTYNFAVCDVTPDELAKRILARQNIAAICLNDKGQFHRAKKYFREADIVGVDIDNDGPSYLSLEEALAHPLVRQHCLLVYTTPSHTPEHHKFRLLFWLPETITDRERFEQIVRALIHLFNGDEACKDCSRFFYGAGENGLVKLLGYRLTQAVLDELLTEFAPLAEESCRPLENESTSAQDWVAYNFDGESIEARKQMYAQRAIDIATRIIDESVPPVGDYHGNRHKARTRAAYLLGGYVAGGILMQHEARAALSSAVSRNTSDFNAAMQTVDDCLSAGLSEPITFDMLEREREQYLRQKHAAPRIQPPALEERRTKAQALREMVIAASQIPTGKSQREISECVDILNSIFSRAKCPTEVKEFMLAVIGAVQERTQPGQEGNWFEANDFEIGKRMRGDDDDEVDRIFTREELRATAKREGVSVAEFRARYERRRSERIKKTAQRKRTKCDAWQKRTGYIFIESQNGGRKAKENYNTRYRVPILIEAAEALILAREKRTHTKNPKKVIQAEAKLALQRLEGTFTKRERFKRPGRDARSVIESNNKLILTKLKKNLHLTAQIGEDPLEYYEQHLADEREAVTGLGLTPDDPPIVHKETEESMDKYTGQDKVNRDKSFNQPKVANNGAEKANFSMDKSVPPPNGSKSFNTNKMTNDGAESNLQNKMCEALDFERVRKTNKTGIFSVSEPVRLGQAIWRHSGFEQPVVVVAEDRRGPDGKRYVHIQGDTIVIPADELVYDDSELPGPASELERMEVVGW